MKKFAYARRGQLLYPNRKFTFINTYAGRLANVFFFFVSILLVLQSVMINSVNLQN